MAGDTTMKVLVCGSRDWLDPGIIRMHLAFLAEQRRGDVEVIHGAARGADQMAATAARALGLTETPYPADWRGKGKAAGILRNLQMLDQEPDLVLAYQRNGSTGTQHTIDEARKRGIPVEVVTDTRVGVSAARLPNPSGWPVEPGGHTGDRDARQGGPHLAGNPQTGPADVQGGPR